MGLERLAVFKARMHKRWVGGWAGGGGGLCAPEQGTGGLGFSRAKTPTAAQQQQWQRCSIAILTRKHRLRPGPTVTATALSCCGATPARASASSTQLAMAASWASCASLGTTPPQGAWMSACVASASPSTRPQPLTTATPVSSQLLSMPRTSGGCAGPAGWAAGACVGA